MKRLISRGNKRLAVVVSLVIIATFLAQPSFASHVDSVSHVFESKDGNLMVDANPVGDAVDWGSFTNTTTAAAWNFHEGTDPVNGSGDDIFAGGTKQDDECAGIVPDSGGGANTKTDITRFYVANKLILGHEFLSLAWERVPQSSVSSSSFVGFEFYQNAVSCGSGSPLIHRTAGDMLVVYNFEGGDADSVVKLSRWLTKANNDSNTDCENGIQASKFVACWGKTQTLTATQFADGKVNNFGTVDEPLHPSVSPLGVVEFGEAGIDLTAAGVFPEGTCQTFGKGDAVSRTSGNSAQAQNKDLIAPINVNISNCGSLDVSKTSNDGGSQVGAVFTLTGPSPSTATVSCTVVTGGHCGATSPSFPNLAAGTYSLDETFVPAGYTKPPGLPETIVINAGDAIVKSYTDNAVPGNINVDKTDDASNPLGGAVFTLTGPSPSTTTRTCTTRGPAGVPAGSNSDGSAPTVDGRCSFLLIPSGSYSLDETTVPTGYHKASGLPTTIQIVNGQTYTAGPFSDPRTFKVIVLVCQESNGKLYPTPITIESTASGNSLSTAQATSAGLSESALCGISTGSKGDLEKGNRTASANIP